MLNKSLKIKNFGGCFFHEFRHFFSINRIFYSDNATVKLTIIFKKNVSM